MERHKEKEAQQPHERTKRCLTSSLATGQKGKSAGARARGAVSAGVTTTAASTLPSGARGGARGAVRHAHGRPYGRAGDRSFGPGHPGRRWGCPVEKQARAPYRPGWEQPPPNKPGTSSKDSAGGGRHHPHTATAAPRLPNAGKPPTAKQPP